jgi:ribosomal protein S18 acetylase RimI-like enzyme
LLREWYSAVLDEWGECGRVAYEDETVLGFIKYAPPRFFPQARNFAAGPPEDDAVLLACIHVRDEARSRGLGSLLLRAALRDLVVRGEKSVQSFACTSRTGLHEQPVMGVEFLLRNGFNVVRPHPVYPLLRLDLRSLATWTENLEVVLESLRIPVRQPGRVPTPTVNMKR